MSERSERFVRLIADLEDLTDEISPHEAVREMDDSTLQVFWRRWPHISSWAGSLWRELNSDLDDTSTPEDDGVAEIGEGG
jgi:hypothetical protein